MLANQGHPYIYTQYYHTVYYITLRCVPRACVIDSHGLGITCILYHSTTSHSDLVSCAFYAIPIFHILKIYLSLCSLNRHDNGNGGIPSQPVMGSEIIHCTAQLIDRTSRYFIFWYWYNGRSCYYFLAV